MAGLFATSAVGSDGHPFRVSSSLDKIDVIDGIQPVATYVFRDDLVTRPFFCDLHGPGGVRVSRNHPPVQGKDALDHPTYHPGLWLAFGDLRGSDNWRLKARVNHVRMLQEPTVASAHVDFAVENRYLAEGESPQTICTERCRYEIHATDWGYLLTWDSTFWGDREFWFGDQEEMGLGIRVATPLRVDDKRDDSLIRGTGTILDNEGRRNGSEVWGQIARWVDYGGHVSGQPAGMTILCHPDNFRPTRLHARDYGFIAANLFATAAFHVGEPSRTVVKQGSSLRLRYGVLLRAGELLDAAALELAYLHYLGLAKP